MRGPAVVPQQLGVAVAKQCAGESQVSDLAGAIQTAGIQPRPSTVVKPLRSP